MIRNAKAKGSRLERRTRALFPADEGWLTLRAAGSLGPIDIVALHPGDDTVQLIQVKSNRWPGRAEMAALRKLAGRCTSACWSVAIVRWDDRRRDPLWRYV